MHHTRGALQFNNAQRDSAFWGSDQYGNQMSLAAIKDRAKNCHLIEIC